MSFTINDSHLSNHEIDLCLCKESQLCPGGYEVIGQRTTEIVDNSGRTTKDTVPLILMIEPIEELNRKLLLWYRDSPDRCIPERIDPQSADMRYEDIGDVESGKEAPIHGRVVRQFMHSAWPALFCVVPAVLFCVFYSLCGPSSWLILQGIIDSETMKQSLE